MLNLGHLLLSVGRNDESLELSETAIAENEASGLDLRRGAMNRNNASEALFALGRWDEAIAQADTVRNRIEFRFAGRMACLTRARVATARGEDELAAPCRGPLAGCRGARRMGRALRRGPGCDWRWPGAGGRQ